MLIIQDYPYFFIVFLIYTKLHRFPKGTEAATRKFAKMDIPRFSLGDFIYFLTRLSEKDILALVSRGPYHNLKRRNFGTFAHLFPFLVD